MEIFREAFSNNLKEVKKYLIYGDVNIKDENDQTLLHHAVLGNCIEMVELLLDNYINCNCIDKFGYTPIFHAVNLNLVGIVKLLIRYKADINIYDRSHNNVLFIAVKNNNLILVEILINSKLLFSKNSFGENILFFATKYNYSDVLSLFKYEELVEQKTYLSESIMHYAVKYNNLKVVEFLNNRYYINLKNKYGDTVFDYGLKYSNREVMNQLIKFLPVVKDNSLELIKENPYEIKDIFDNYLFSLKHLEYKKKYLPIYVFLLEGETSLSYFFDFDKEKKDSFKLSLNDYLKMYN